MTDYEMGAQKAWEIARKLVLSESDGGMSYDDVWKYFGNKSFREIFKDYSAEDIIKKWDEYINEICVGDELQGLFHKAIVIKVEDDCVRVLRDDFIFGRWMKNNLYTKTGRHIDLSVLFEEKGSK